MTVLRRQIGDIASLWSGAGSLPRAIRLQQFCLVMPITCASSAKPNNSPPDKHRRLQSRISSCVMTTPAD
jgi:hypothetical protein